MVKNLLFRMLSADKRDVATAIEMYFAKTQRAEQESIKSMPDRGYEEIFDDGDITPDGREIVPLYGKRWALRKDVYEKRFEEASSPNVVVPDEKTAETKSVAGTDGPSIVLCPKCGDMLQYSTICPACSAGRAGYRHRYSCVNGCVDFASKVKI